MGESGALSAVPGGMCQVDRVGLAQYRLRAEAGPAAEFQTHVCLLRIPKIGSQFGERLRTDQASRGRSPARQEAPAGRRTTGGGQKQALKAAFAHPTQLGTSDRQRRRGGDGAKGTGHPSVQRYGLAACNKCRVGVVQVSTLHQIGQPLGVNAGSRVEAVACKALAGGPRSPGRCCLRGGPEPSEVTHRIVGSRSSPGTHRATRSLQNLRWCSSRFSARHPYQRAGLQHLAGEVGQARPFTACQGDVAAMWPAFEAVHGKGQSG
jgi:hypothetical protein